MNSSNGPPPNSLSGKARYLAFRLTPKRSQIAVVIDGTYGRTSASSHCVNMKWDCSSSTETQFEMVSLWPTKPYSLLAALSESRNNFWDRVAVSNLRSGPPKAHTDWKVYRIKAVQLFRVFQVQSNGSTVNGGVNLDPSAKLMTINVTAVTQPPVGASKTVTTLENKGYVFGVTDFGFTDPNNNPANTFTAVEITTLPVIGTLTDNGVAVTVGQFVPVADISSGLLVFTSAVNTSGADYTSFTFQVQSSGSTANGGVNVDPTPRTMTINVTPVTQAPVGTSKTVTTPENQAYTFAVADFGFTDPNNTPANTLTAVKITTKPGVGTLKDNGVVVTIGQFVTVADISGGKLVFTPATNASGVPYTSFTFQVQSSGSTANGGVNLDPSPKTITINVT